LQQLASAPPSNHVEKQCSRGISVERRPTILRHIISNICVSPEVVPAAFLGNACWTQVSGARDSTSISFKKGLEMKARVLACALAVFVFAGLAAAQTSSTSQTVSNATQNATPYMLPRNAISVGVGFLSSTGDPGFTAVNVFGGLRHRGLELAGEFDAGGTNIKVPAVTVKVRQQDYVFGPRFYFSRALSNPRFVPFAHLLFGLSRINSEVTGGPADSDTAYSWDFGGGLEYHFNNQWGIRGRADAFRTHFLDESQTHLRYGAGVVYVIGR
jgi:hypothetical protein